MSSVNNVQFGNEPQQKRTSGILFPTVGLATGLGVAGLTKYGNKEALASLEGVDHDTFQKMVTASELTDDSNAKTILAHLKKEAPKTETPAAETKVESKTAAKAPSAKSTQKSTRSLASGLELKEIFEDGKTELKYDEYLAKKYGAYNVQDLMDKIKEGKAEIVELAGDPTKPSKAMKSAKFTVDETKKAGKLMTEYLNTTIKQQAIAKEIEALEEAQKALTKGSPQYVVSEKRIAGLKKQSTALDTQLKAIEKQGDAFKKKLPGLASKEPVSKEAIEEMLEKAGKDGGRIDVAMKKAANSELKKVQDAAVEAAKKAAKAAKEPALTPDEIKAIREGITKDHPQVVKAMEAAGAKKGTELKNELMKTQTKAFIDGEVKKAEHDFAKATKAFERKKAAVAEMDADLQLVRDARKNGTTITKEASESITSKTYSKAVEAVKSATNEAKTSKLPKVITEAFEAIKGKLKPEKSMIKLGAYAAGGLALGYIIKMMTDGPSEPQA